MKSSRLVDQYNQDNKIYHNDDIIDSWCTNFLRQLEKKEPNPISDTEYQDVIENKTIITFGICKKHSKHSLIIQNEIIEVEVIPNTTGR